MKSSKLMAALLPLLLLGVAGVGDATASDGHRHFHGHHGHSHAVVRFGFVAGPVWPWYYGPPYYYPPVVEQVVSPPVYIERQPPELASAATPANYWYYCDASAGYYPYVRECPGGWQRVAPQPPASPDLDGGTSW